MKHPSDWFIWMTLDSNHGAYEGRDKANVLGVANLHKQLLLDKVVQQHTLATLKAAKGFLLLQPHRYEIGMFELISITIIYTSIKYKLVNAMAVIFLLIILILTQY